MVLGDRMRRALAIIVVISALGINSARAQTIDDKYSEISLRVPEFGGFFNDVQEGELVLYLTQQRDGAVEEFKAALLDVFSPPNLNGLQLDNIVVRHAAYDWLQLKGWIDVLRADPVEGVMSRSIDRTLNRLTIGVVDPAQEGSDIKAELGERGIPWEAVILVESGPIKFENSATKNRHVPWWSVAILVFAFAGLGVRLFIGRGSRARTKLGASAMGSGPYPPQL